MRLQSRPGRLGEWAFERGGGRQGVVSFMDVVRSR